MTRETLIFMGLLVQSAVCWAEASAPPTPDELTARAQAIRPRADELKWQQIPWLRGLEQAQRVARRERRPIFLFVSAYDPLGRC